MKHYTRVLGLVKHNTGELGLVKHNTGELGLVMHNTGELGFSISVCIMCLMFVQHFEPLGSHFINFHYYH